MNTQDLMSNDALFDQDLLSPDIYPSSRSREDFLIIHLANTGIGRIDGQRNRWTVGSRLSGLDDV
jgi:hypothetical protein